MAAKNIEVLFEEHYGLIKNTVRRNRRLLRTLKLEDDDVAQDLSIRMLSAIEKFNPERSDSLAAHIVCSLQYAILDMKRRYKPHGITGVASEESIDFLYMDAMSYGLYELPYNDDTSALEFSELTESLSEAETEVLDLKLKGFYPRRRAQNSALSAVRSKYDAFYKNEGRIAA